MSQNTPRNAEQPAQDTDTADGDDELIELRSPYRPYPLGAKKALREAVDVIELSDEDSRCAYVSDVPDDDLLEQWELSVVRTDDPEEVWETDRGETIEIFADRVERNGREMNIEPAEAKERAAEQDYFTRVPVEDQE